MNNKLNTYFPDSVSLPGDTLIETMSERGFKQIEFADRIGVTVKTLNEIIKGKAPISPDTALKLEKVLNVPATFWLKLEYNYREYVARKKEQINLLNHVNWLNKFPVKEMINFGWLKSYADKQEMLKELLIFHGVGSPEDWNKYWLNDKASVAFRISLKHVNNSHSIASWLRHGEIVANKAYVNKYDSSTFKKQLFKIRNLTKSPQSEIKINLKSLCANSGVIVVFTPQLPKATISGASRWINDNPLIQLSLRYKTDDHFWFTFFHEAAHIIYHGKKDIFLEGIKNNPLANDEDERKADEIASNILIPPSDFRSFIGNKVYSESEIIKFANKVNISPSIVVGHLQHFGLMGYNFLNHLKTRLEIEMD